MNLILTRIPGIENSRYALHREVGDVKNASTKQEGRRDGKSKVRGYDVKDAGIRRGGELTERQ